MQLESLFQIGRCTIALENFLSSALFVFLTFLILKLMIFLSFYLFLNFRNLDYCENIAQIEGHVSVKFLESIGRQPHNLTSLLSEEELFELQNEDRKLRKLFEDMRQIYSDASQAGFKIEPDSFDRVRLMNRLVIKFDTVKLVVLSDCLAISLRVVFRTIGH